MQIRKRHGRLEFLRSYYDSVKKRSSQKLIGAMDSWKTELPADLIPKMTQAEVTEVVDYLRRKELQSLEWRKKSKIASVGEDLALVTSAIAEYGVSKELAATIYHGIKGVTRALRAAGFKKKDVFCNQHERQ